MDKDELLDKYNEKYSLYERGGQNISEALDVFLKEKNISNLTISYRIKEFESFYEKINRKNYTNPFAQNEDFCGIRIILYYIDDLPKIESIIESEFEVVTKEIKADNLDINEFGYRSNHFIIKLKKSWLETPNYRGLSEMKFEIQVRTILMHAWAEIEHELGYKNKNQVPESLERKLFMISAKLEEADMQFQEIKNNVDNYKTELINTAVENKKFTSKEFNINVFQALLDFYFPNNPKNNEETSHIYNRVLDIEISIEELVNYAEKIEPLIPFIEKQLYTENSNLKTSQANIINYAIQSFHPNVRLGSCTKSRKRIIEKLKKM